MPASWQELFGTASGTAWFRRHFHQPTGLEPHERVWITLTDVPGEVRLSLNGTAVPSQPAGASRVVADVTEQLELANRLEVCVTFDPEQAPDAPGGLWQPVILEIHNKSHAGR
ncbi:MAG: hypothetical protein ACF8TS_10295 [Maioricimonas sp. JB049]